MAFTPASSMSPRSSHCDPQSLTAPPALAHLPGNMQVFVMSHSWGDNVFRNFLAWVGEDDEAWAEKHVAHYANIAGPTLGVPKSISIFLSGSAPCKPMRWMLADPDY